MVNCQIPRQLLHNQQAKHENHQKRKNYFISNQKKTKKTKAATNANASKAAESAATNENLQITTQKIKELEAKVKYLEEKLEMCQKEVNTKDLLLGKPHVSYITMCLCSTPGGVQYTGGFSVHWRVIIEYTGGYSVHRGI